MKIVESINSWMQARRDRKAKALPEGFLDIVDLYKRGLVIANGTGQSITDIRAEIVSRVGVPLKVSVRHGTYFVSSGNHQNMVTRRKYEFELPPMDAKRISIPASCINAALPIPDHQDKFNGVARVPNNVRRFLEAAEGEDAMVIQAGLWSLTDGYSRRKIQSTLRTRRVATRNGIPTGLPTDAGPAISTAQIDKAKAVLDLLKIRNTL